jgi:hypothetical protein
VTARSPPRAKLTTELKSTSSDARTEGHGSRARIRLLALLLLTVFFAGGVLFVKLKLEDLRAVFEVEAEKRTGIDLGIGKVQVNGLKGLIIQDFHTTLPLPNGPSVDIAAPVTYVFINIADLFYGQVNIDRVQLDEAKITVHRPAGTPWFARSGGEAAAADAAPPSPTPAPTPASVSTAKPASAPGLPSALAFRVLGRNCSLKVNNVVGDTAIELAQLDFDALRLTDSTDYSVKLSGLVSNNPDKDIALNLRFASLDDFDVRLHSGLVTAEDVNVFLPAEQQFVAAGSARASVRVAGYPGGTMVVSMEAPFEGLRLRNQPELLQPVTGSLSALGNYQIDTRVLTLTTAQAQSEQIGGRLEGTVSFAAESPEFDLRLHAGQLPIRDALQYALDLAGQSLEGLDLDLKEPYAINIALKGTPKEPIITASADLSEGTLAYRPKGKNQPEVDLVFGGVNLSWNSQETGAKGSLSVRDGTVNHPETGIKAQKIMGTLVITPEGVTLDPLNAEVRGNPFVGNAAYSNATKQVTFSVSGAVANIENTPLGSGIEKLSVAGSAAVRCSGKVSKEHQTFDLAIDATQAAIGYEWWFRKPAGIGLSLNGVNVDITPNKAIKIAGQAMLDTVPISANIEVRSRKGKWALETIRAKSEAVDAATADKCLEVQYALAGKPATDFTLDWKRTDAGPDTHTFTVAGHVDELFATPKGGKAPIEVRDARVVVTVEDGKVNTGDVTVTAKQGAMPPMGDTWFVPLQADDPAWRAKYPEEPRAWAFHVQTAAMSLPPWQASAFTCEGTNANDVTDIASFTAVVGKGSLTGTYHLEEKDNIGKLRAEWKDVPAKYMLQHLKFPEILNGDVTGMVEYTMDQDDPGTIKGVGKFDVTSGQFSWDVLQQQFKDTIAAGMAGMPSLKFSRLSMDVLIEGDKIITNNISLVADGLGITGDGSYVTEGDMDYTLKVAITPATAERIPILRDSFNIEGHRLTQNNIELAFHVTGPAFQPQGEVAGLPPVGVTLVSGAAELTSEALKVIDLPRQILLDLFKIGGAVAGAPK